MKYQATIWRHKVNGKWLVFDQSRTHVKIRDKFSLTDDIEKASVLKWIPGFNPDRKDFEPVTVNVTYEVKIADD